VLLVLHVFTRDFSHCLRDALIFTCETTASARIYCHRVSVIIAQVG